MLYYLDRKKQLKVSITVAFLTSLYESPQKVNA